MKEQKNPGKIAYDFIEENIIKNRWTPGMKITSENQMASDLGISRASVREAIEKLVALNVLHKRKGGGTFVNELSPSIYLNGLLPMLLIDSDKLIDILVFRRIIETESAMLCAQNAEDSLLNKLEECYEAMKNSIDDREKFSYYDYKFHYYISEGTKNSLIIKINTILTDLLKHHQKQLNISLGSDSGVKDHKKILDALKDRDGELVSLYMRRHLTRTIDEIEALNREESV